MLSLETSKISSLIIHSFITFCIKCIFCWSDIECILLVFLVMYFVLRRSDTFLCSTRPSTEVQECPMQNSWTRTSLFTLTCKTQRTVDSQVGLKFWNYVFVSQWVRYVTQNLEICPINNFKAIFVQTKVQCTTVVMLRKIFKTTININSLDSRNTT